MRNKAEFEYIMDSIREEVIGKISDQGLSQMEYSKLIGISRNTLSNFLQGNTNSYFQTIFKIVSGLEISLDKFVENYNTPKKP